MNTNNIKLLYVCLNTHQYIFMRVTVHQDSFLFHMFWFFN